MHPRLLRFPLGPGFEPSAVFAAIYGDRDDVFWLDSGPDGVSYLGAGTPIPVAPGTVWDVLRAVPGLLVAPDDSAPTFRLGMVGWLGYELRAQTTGATVTRPSRYPDAAFLRIDRAIAIDGTTGQAELLALAESWSGELAEWRDTVARLAGASGPPASEPAAVHVAWHETDAQYLANIVACQAAIRDGEAYQLCLTTEAGVAGRFDPLDVFLRLRLSSPSHHGGLIRIGGVSLLSASPERFLDIDPAGVVRTRPIKGTRPRGPDPTTDAEQIAELRTSDKERAENLMIVDLMRNDLARVCDLGTVTVTELLEVETYPQVHQLVSTVTGRLAPGRSPIDAIEACFPAGSMTGAPKLRATQVLDRLEQRPRGLYAGCFGYLGLDGRVDLAMTIRSIVLDARGATVGAGGGITALSVPAEELAEAKLKAAALLTALGVPPEPGTPSAA